jgi:pilus assembly protein Flp/PilA
MDQLLKLIIAVHTRATTIIEKERGATATEYALLVAFIALVIVAGVTVFGSSLNTFFSNLGTKIGLINAS